MTLVPHPLLQRDIVGIAEHVFAVSGDVEAARRRLAETRQLIADIIREPQLGSPLSGDLGGWRVRHGGRDRRILVVFRHDAAAGRLHLALVAFGGQNWTSRLPARVAHFAPEGEQG